MKLAVTLILAMSITPLYGQQRWCFSSQRPEPPSVMFRAGANGNPLFPFANVSGYQPVAPLAFSPAVRQFFVLSESGLASLPLPIIRDIAAPSTNPVSHVRAIPGAASARSFSLTGPSFSDGSGSLGFHR